MSQAYANSPVQQVAQRAVSMNGILQSAESPEVLKRLSPPNFAFSIDVDSEAVANQKMSGRCWMFACLNFLRWHIEKALDLPKGTFELSQAYLAFYAKLERAAWFLEHAIKTAAKPMGEREVYWLYSNPMVDGGDWDMIAGLVKKYGVIPHENMSETVCTNNTAELNTVLSHLLRQDGLKLREMTLAGQDTTQTVQDMLTEVYRILAVAFGEPPKKIFFEYRDNKKNYHGEFDMTPQEFAQKYVKVNLDDYIGVVNVPTSDYYKMYTVEDSDMIPERTNLYLNVPMQDLKDMVLKQLDNGNGEPIWFGCDVLQHCDRNAGVMSKDLFDLGKMFGVQFTMDKETRYLTHESLPTHAMMIAGVDMVNGKPDKWKIENTWGTENNGKKTGNNGYFVCDDWWFDNFVYEVAINKKYFTDKMKAALDTTPEVWPFYSTFNPV